MPTGCGLSKFIEITHKHVTSSPKFAQRGRISHLNSETHVHNDYWPIPCSPYKQSHGKWLQASTSFDGAIRCWHLSLNTLWFWFHNFQTKPLSMRKVGRGNASTLRLITQNTGPKIKAFSHLCRRCGPNRWWHQGLCLQLILMFVLM